MWVELVEVILTGANVTFKEYKMIMTSFQKAIRVNMRNCDQYCSSNNTGLTSVHDPTEVTEDELLWQPSAQALI